MVKVICIHLISNSNWSLFLADPSANTPCLRRQLEARRNKRLGVFVPRCLTDGSYAKVQCHGSICFCMNEEGEEVPGTRGNRHHPPNCTGETQLPPGNSKYSYYPLLVVYQGIFFLL